MNASRPLSLSGHVLQGRQFVRMAYLDEAGIANPAHEPYVIVAGVIVHADTQWVPIERGLAELAATLPPVGQKRGFVFHAMDLFHGLRAFPREQWEKEARWQILDELARIPSKFNLPIVYGRAKRSAYENGVKAGPSKRAAFVTMSALLNAFADCAREIDGWMLAHTTDEVASLVLERTDTHAMIKNVYNVLRSPTIVRTMPQFHIKRIIETPHFAEKAHCSILQIADVCAFAIKRNVMSTPESARFFDPLRPCIVNMSSIAK